MAPSVLKFGRYFLLCINDEKEAIGFFAADKSSIREIKSLSLFLKKISGKYLLLLADEKEYDCDELSLRRLLRIAENKRAGIVYSDYFLRKGNNLIHYPLIDYQQGSIRDDFNFGHIYIFSCAAVKSALQKYGSLPSDPSVALYDLRLKVSIDYPIFHVPEFLYTVEDRKEKFVKSDNRIENHFAYTAAGNIVQQKKLEKVATNYLKMTGAYLKARTKKAPRAYDFFPAEASIIIPVLNRKTTIKDAIQSALAQKTDFDFNIIIVDNHSTDGTTEILNKYAAKYSQIRHIIPPRRDLGIGGCWNEAIYSSHCGRYAVQLDSDDLYSSKHTLQKIVDTLRRENYALVIGSYTIVNERLKKIPPGLIAHKEWTQANGHNNALRINGLGAPRAFNTAIIRKIGFPNVSYGEDYAVALRISREYKIGRIYENLYWCRRWKQNTDAGLSVENKNRNDFYKDKLRSAEIAARRLVNRAKGKPSFIGGKIFAEFSNGRDVSLLSLCRNLYDEQKKTWPVLAKACFNLSAIKTRKLTGKKYNVSMQYNPARATSSGAAVDAESIKNRPCFLCRDNLPSEQQAILYRNHYLILCNPAPIFKNHYTIASLRHKPQEITESIKWFLQLSADVYPEYIVFYNGPACGASAPDHLHFQMIPANALPFLIELKELPTVKEISSVRYLIGNSIDRSVIVLESKNANEMTKQFSRLLKAAQKILMTKGEPLVNIICTYTGECWRLVIFLRRKHRPDAYFAEGEKRIFISPGAIDMAGVIITPRLDDYQRLNGDSIRDIYREVSLPEVVTKTIMNQL